MPPLTDAELSYIAALIDTRANLTSRTVRDAVLPQVDINGRPAEVLVWLGEITGVKVVPTRRDFTKHGCAEHCKDRHVHVRSLSVRWSLSGAKATIVLAAVLPHLRLRRGDVQDAITLGLRAGQKGATIAKMRALGWPIPDAMAPS
jgi:hypothetical protein